MTKAATETATKTRKVNGVDVQKLSETVADFVRTLSCFRPEITQSLCRTICQVACSLFDLIERALIVSIAGRVSRLTQLATTTEVLTFRSRRRISRPAVVTVSTTTLHEEHPHSQSDQREWNRIPPNTVTD